VSSISIRRLPSRARLETLAGLFVLAALVWAAKYWHSAEFGLYEDDYTRTPAAMEMTGQQLVAQVMENFKHLSDHGKPLHGSLIYSLTFLGSQFGGLRGVYGLGFLFVVGNTWLLFALLRRLQGACFALVAGMAYALFAADTSQAFLTHALGLQPSMLFILLAFHSYLSRKPWLGYGLALLSLITYETAFPLFLAAPLLLGKEQAGGASRWLSHVVVLGLILAGVTSIRSVLGESRVSDLSWPMALITSGKHMIQGPIVSLGTYFYRPLQVLRSVDEDEWIMMGVGFAVLFSVLLALRTPASNHVRQSVPAKRTRGPRNCLPKEFAQLGRMAVAGLILLVLAYPLTFTVRAYAISGRDTRVHFAAAPGASILFACAWVAILALLSGPGRRAVGLAVLAGQLTLLLGFGLLVQHDYVLAWQLQKDFWRELVPLVPDAGEGTVVLVSPEGLQDPLQIGANTWALPRVLEQMYDFPASWDRPPRVYRLISGWEANIATAPGVFEINDGTTIAPPSSYVEVPSANVILIETAGGRLTRTTAPRRIGDEVFALKEVGGSRAGGFGYRWLYYLLTQEG